MCFANFHGSHPLRQELERSVLQGDSGVPSGSFGVRESLQRLPCSLSDRGAAAAFPCTKTFSLPSFRHNEAVFGRLLRPFRPIRPFRPSMVEAFSRSSSSKRCRKLWNGASSRSSRGDVGDVSWNECKDWRDRFWGLFGLKHSWRELLSQEKKLTVYRKIQWVWVSVNMFARSLQCQESQRYKIRMAVLCLCSAEDTSSSQLHSRICRQIAHSSCQTTSTQALQSVLPILQAEKGSQ